MVFVMFEIKRRYQVHVLTDCLKYVQSLEYNPISENTSQFYGKTTHVQNV